MSAEKDVERKQLSRDILNRQIEESRRAINYAQQSILAFTQQLQQQQGILNYAEHLLAQFEIPEATKPEDPKKTPLEVK
jgi:hypothetical protein